MRRGSEGASEAIGTPNASRRRAIAGSTIDAGRHGRGQHRADDQRAASRSRSGRGPITFIPISVASRTRGRDIARHMEAPEHFADDGRGPRPPDRRVHTLERGKCCGRDDACDRNHAAEPHDEGDDVRITQRGHPGIIVRFTLPSPFTPTVPAVVVARVDRGCLRARAHRSQACPAVDHRIVVSRVRGDGSRSRTPTRRSSRSSTSRFVPVRVDADRRPDVNERYNLDGWPTTALLTPSGEMLTGTTYLPSGGLRAMLLEVSDAYRTRQRGARPTRRLDDGVASGTEPADARAGRARSERTAMGCASRGRRVRCAARRIRDRREVPAHRGSARRRSTRCARTGDPGLRDALTQTLDAMADGQIRDAVEGGFFRYAGSRDWSARTPRRCSRTRLAWSTSTSKPDACSTAHDIGTSLETRWRTSIARWRAARRLRSLPARPRTSRTTR